jgi:uncharacterized protein (DUF488 family)
MNEVFTIGHSNHSLAHFLTLLRQHRIDMVVDTRSYPHSKYATHFDREPLNAALGASAVQYLYLGRELGGRPPGEAYYDSDGHVLYDKVAESPLFGEGLSRVLAESVARRVALACAEENPRNCHRRLLIARVLAERGVTVWHIRGDGRLQSEEALCEEEQGPQLSLFENTEAGAWRST